MFHSVNWEEVHCEKPELSKDVNGIGHHLPSRTAFTWRD
jgi:hypothetical protein